MEYGLIGGNLSYSFSKVIHEKLADYTYELCPLKKEELDPFMRQHAFCAINVTNPYKQDVIPYLAGIEENAQAIGAVNTIINAGGLLYGYNTDHLGFLYLLHANGIRIEGKKVLVLGTGGASKAITAALKTEKAGQILLVSRSGKDGAVTYEEAAARHADAQVIVNTTPVGTSPNVTESPIDLTPFSFCESVVDIVYNPKVTMLAAQAAHMGIKAVTGLDMLVAQAKYACELFCDKEIDDSVIPRISAEIAEEMYRS